MPGFIVRTAGKRNDNQTNEFEQSISFLRYSARHTQKTIIDEYVNASGVVQQSDLKSVFIQNNEISIWVHGEQYGKMENLASTLLVSYQEDNLIKTLANIDGYYSALIYDKGSKKIYTITDRYGFKPIYIYKDEGKFVATSELKCMTSFSDVDLTVDNNALQCFFDVGHMLGKLTWFNEVKVQEASTIACYHIETKELSYQKYWSWSRIRSCSNTFEEAVDKTHDLLLSAVAKRSEGHRMSLALSGGLDSRTILACNSDTLELAYTFGKKGSQDVTIASKLSDQDDINHLPLWIGEDNWYKNRIEGIWKTDGMCSMMHMHASQFHGQLADTNTMHLNGFAGDLVLGGSWLNIEDTRITEISGKKYFGKYVEYSNQESSYFDIEKEDPYYIDSRVRRFTHTGISEASKLLPHRLPFFDNDLVEYLYSLPDLYRKDYKLYLAIYKKHFAKKYSNIPYQKTGAPLFATFPMMYKLKQKLNNGLIKFGVKESGQYAAYSKWFNSKQNVFERILSSQGTLIWNYLDGRFTDVIKVNNNEEKLSRLLTIEIWLQQILNNKYRTTEEVFGQ